MSSIIMLISSIPISGMAMQPFLAFRSSKRIETFHSFSAGISKYLTLYPSLEVREPREMSHSFAILETVRPTKVLLSSTTEFTKYLTLDLLLVLRDSMNFIMRPVNMVLGCLVHEMGSIKYRWVVQGSLKIFLIVTFQDEYILVTSGEYRSQRTLP